jgi:serine/threonine-protein kinase HipA
MTPARTLHVYWDRESAPIGELLRKESGDTVFRYAPEGRQISHSLPFDAGAGEHPITFFENLLPDGVQRERLARRLGVSDSSTFSMLDVVGGDCAGALSLLPEKLSGSQRDAGAHRPLDDDLLRKVLELGVVPTSVTEGLRLSLAGAQDKLPVVLENDELFLPLGRTASTHILKLPNREFRGLVDNEHFLLELSHEVGLPTVRSRRWELPTGSDPAHALLVERFDRSGGRRLHQEDLCQATGAPPSRKYESDGGPSLVDVIAVLDAASTEPTDVVRLVKWQAFNIATGNNDGHAKNVSLLREPVVRLAPAYDLVCTRAWDALGKDLAFRVGGARDAGATGPHAWRIFAEQARLSPKLVLDAAAEVATSVAERSRLVAERLMDEGCDARAIRCALLRVTDQAQRALRLQELERAPPKPKRKRASRSR